MARSFFAPVAKGGLGIVYDNEKTRTVSEVWRDRKANCISLTALYVSACRVLGIRAQFAEAPSVSLWVRYGSMVYNEKHMVAAIQVDIMNTLTADFGGVPIGGTLRVKVITESRFRALFHSNRAVESIRAGDLALALADAKASVDDDPESGVGWNVYGVVEKALGENEEAERAFLKALAVDPASGAACGNLEALYRLEGNGVESARYREMGLKLRDQDPYFHAFLAKEALGSGSNDEALTQIKKAIRGQGMEADFYLILAQAELNRGERRAAEKAVQKAMHWSSPDQRKRMESKLALIESLNKT
ncbi:MAG TPA: tetratricopeptide repeat protein [Holophagaceae bacterium]|nr:tetratricopeptide repeat protein [Holophagaceae bacterium]